MTHSKDNSVSVEEILRNRVKVIGDGEWTLLGTPNDVINELEAYATSRVVEELQQIKKLSNGKFHKQIVVTGDGQIVLQQLLKIYSYSVNTIAKLKADMESL